MGGTREFNRFQSIIGDILQSFRRLQPFLFFRMNHEKSF